MRAPAYGAKCGSRRKPGSRCRSELEREIQHRATPVDIVRAEPIIVVVTRDAQRFVGQVVDLQPHSEHLVELVRGAEIEDGFLAQRAYVRAVPAGDDAEGRVVLVPE